jgi:2-dehydropantoate 2-reductase
MNFEHMPELRWWLGYPLIMGVMVRRAEASTSSLRSVALMRIVVMGAGGSGGFFGAKLARAGEDVTFVARGAHLRAIEERGLTVHSVTDGDWTVRTVARERLEGQPPADLVLFCVKSFDTETAAETIRPVVGPATGVLSIQNGVDNEDKLAAILGPGHVIAGIAEVFAVIEAPGVIRHSLLGRLRFGEPDGKESSRTRAFLEACGRAGIPAELAPDPLRMLWEKYVFLVAQSGMSASRAAAASCARSQRRAMYGQLLGELVRLGRAVGAGIDEGLAEALLARLDGLGADAYSSLHHDLVHGRRLELEALQGHAIGSGRSTRFPRPPSPPCTRACGRSGTGARPKQPADPPAGRWPGRLILDRCRRFGGSCAICVPIARAMPGGSRVSCSPPDSRWPFRGR